jgi:hypothetical protein
MTYVNRAAGAAHYQEDNMSTRSIIAVQHGDTFRGRYCHSDGYPTWMGKTLFTEMKAAGVDTLEAFLSEDGLGAWGISYLAPGFLTDPRPMPWDEAGQFPAGKWEDYNFRVYRNRAGEEPSDWMLGTDTMFSGTEWCYVCSVGGLMIGKVCFDKDACEDYIKWLAFVPWLAEDFDWAAVEEEGYNSDN